MLRKRLIKKLKRGKKPSGQSFVELMLIFPLLLVMLAGMVEVAFFMFTYLTALDLTRGAARFASIRDYREQVLEDTSTPERNPTSPEFDPSTACTDSTLHFYYDTACFFTDPTLNPFIEFRADKYDDVVITVFTIANNVVSERHPSSGYWSLYNDNWKKDCDGNIVTDTPYFTNADIQSKFEAGAPSDRGIVVIEAYVCHDLILGIAFNNIPLVKDFIHSPVRIHAYTMMPSPEAIPTPTPIP
jgi:hypothetical protein